MSLFRFWFCSLLSLAWPGAQPCGARRAERLGRSGGPGQRRSRRDGCQLRGPLLHLAPDSLSPRMLRWRYPLRLGPRRTRPGGPLRSLLENRLGRCGDLLPTQRAPSILDLDTTVPPLAHQHLAPRRRIATLRLELEKAVLVSHHPVLADRAFALQPENLVQFRGPRRTSVIILQLRRRSPKPLVVFRQIVPLQIYVGLFVTADLLAPQLFHQPVLMGAVDPLHAPLGLRRTGRDQLDPQLRAHAPKLRDRLFSAPSLLRRGGPLIQVLPIHVQRQRHAVALDPGAQPIRYRPDGLLLAQLRPGRVGGVIDHIDQAALGTALLQPGVKDAIHLHHLAKVFLALPPTTVYPPLPLAAPQPLRQHPAPQRFGIHPQSILRGQVLRRQRRTETLAHPTAVLFPHQMQHLPPKLRVVSTMRGPSCAAVLQTRSPLFPIPLPPPLRLPLPQPHQPPRNHHPQLLAAHSGPHLDSPQPPLAHLCPPQSGLLSEVVLRGHFYRGQKGTLSSRYNSALMRTLHPAPCPRVS